MDLLNQLVPDYVDTRTRRLELAKQVTELQEKEAGLKAAILQIMQANELSVVGTGRVQLVRRTITKYGCNDWPSLFSYISASGNWQLLQQRLSEPAVAELFASASDPVPAIYSFDIEDLSRPQKVR